MIRHILLNPILQEVRSLGPEQRSFVRKLIFWFLFAYLETYFVRCAAPDLLIGVLASALILGAMQGTELRRRFSFTILHAGVIASMCAAFVRVPSAIVIIDASVLALLVVLELINRSIVLLLLIAAEHTAALFVDPWSQFRLMPASLPVAAHAVARVLAISVVLAMAWRELLRRWNVAAASHVPAIYSARVATPSRPLSVAEWERRNRQ